MKYALRRLHRLSCLGLSPYSSCALQSVADPGFANGGGGFFDFESENGDF